MIQVSMTGEPGCGKTTVAKLVAAKLEAEYMSTGSIQRAIAAERGVTTLELNKIAETDPSIDQEIDAHTMALASSPRTVVIDSRLAWRFLPSSLKVFLVCPPEVAAKRVFGEGRAAERYESWEQAVKSLVTRHDSEKERFARYYGAALGNLRNYDLVVDTSEATPEQISQRICDLAQARQRVTSLPRVLVSPRSLLPAQDAAQVTPQRVEELRAHLGDEAIARGEVGTLEVCRVGSCWGLIDGHKRVALALRSGARFLSARLKGLNDEVMWPGCTARSFFAAEIASPRTRSWEQAFGFEFRAYPESAA